MQQDIFSVLYEKYIIKKPIRLIELFAGYGSQALALKYLGIEFEHYRVVEFDKYAIQSYNEIHGTNFETKDITQTTAEDLKIVDTGSFTYLLTYSFPCTDLSVAGKMKGMSKNSGTRSGLLWEVERILDECEELPQILLMENVPQVIGTGNVEHFNKWQYKLEQLGYKNYHQNLIATDYGIPQTRNRTFMISILGDYSYTFPQPIPLELKLKDMLEDDVDEKYYLSDKMLNCFMSESENSKFPRKERFIQQLEKSNIKNIAGVITTAAGNRPTDNFIIIPEATKKGVVLKTELCNKLIKENKVKENDVIRHSYSNSRLAEWESRGVELNNMSPTLDTRCDCLGVVTKEEVNLRIRKLTPKECFRLMGVRDEDYEKLTCSNTQKYKQAGNSIVVNVLMAIFKELLGVD